MMHLESVQFGDSTNSGTDMYHKDLTGQILAQVRDVKKRSGTATCF